MRVNGFELERLLAFVRYHGRDDNVFVSVQPEGAIIDPRRCGNVARFVNHSCRPNEKLQEVGICRSKTVVMLQAIEYIPPGGEVNICYGWKSGDTPWPIAYNYGEPECNETI